MLGLIARADDGGLGAQTWELWRHLHPEKTLIVLADHRTRGIAHPERFAGCGEVRVIPASPSQSDAMWLAIGMDTIYSAEGWYGHRPWMAARRRGVKLVLQANPEMFAGEAADVLVAPTPWRMDVLPPEARVLPFPVAADKFRRWEPRPVKTFFHITSSAMNDRNGTELVLQACAQMKQPATLLIRGGERKVETVGRVKVEWLGHHHGPYYQWPDADAFVLPRRYGGLCLPMQEAAAVGLPILSLELEPQSRWLHPAAMILAHEIDRVKMRGGWFPVHSGNPSALADRMDRLITDEVFAKDLADHSVKWAEGLSWTAMLRRYESILR